MDVELLIIVILLPGSRHGFPMMSIRGKIFILGGDTGTLDPTSSVLVSTDGSDWEEAAPLAIPRQEHTAVTTETLQCHSTR